MAQNLSIKELESRFRGVLVRLPAIAGNEVVNFALDNFKKQGFQGDTFQAWKPRKRNTKWNTNIREGRSILVKSGQLRRSIRITQINTQSVTVGSNVPYAKTHNEGLRIGQIQTVNSFTRKNGQQVKSHTRRVDQRIPARPFLAQSQYLTAKLKRVITTEIMKALR